MDGHQLYCTVQETKGQAGQGTTKRRGTCYIVPQHALPWEPVPLHKARHKAIVRGPRPLTAEGQSPKRPDQGVAWAEMAMHNAMYESQRRLTAALDAFRLPAITNIGVA